MPVSFADLHSLGFYASHKIVLNADGAPRFDVLAGASSSDAPAVYLWLAHTAGTDVGEVLYIGKAGRGVSRRSSQHQVGFTTSGTGRKNATALRDILGDENMSVTVMARTSETVVLFGKAVSMYATEEGALCALFSPCLNRAAFPDVTGDDELKRGAKLGGEPGAKLHPSLFEADLADGDCSRIAALINARLRIQDEGTVDDLIAQVEAYMPQDRARLERLLDVLEARLLAPDHGLKLIRGYTGQPKGCNGITTMGFGRLAGRHFAPKGWIARVYLAHSLRVSFPLHLLNVCARGRVATNNELFAPLDIDAFLRDPDNFLAPGSFP